MLHRRLMYKTLRRLYNWARNDPVDEELRGWNWDSPPLKPRAYLELGVSEVAGKYCDTRRDIWLKRKASIQPQHVETLAKGKMVHEAIAHALREAWRNLARGTDPWDAYEYAREKWRKIETNGDSDMVRKIYKATLLTLLGEVAYETLVHGTRNLPVTISEYRVDGSNLGLSHSLSVDVVGEAGIIIDYKTGAPRDFHKLTITGYALALEADYETPHDYGLIVYVNISDNHNPRIHLRPVYVNSHLRRWFIAERDEIIDMLLENREPPISSNCPTQCPYYAVCHP